MIFCLTIKAKNEVLQTKQIIVSMSSSKRSTQTVLLSYVLTPRLKYQIMRLTASEV